jgi:hypothetical protein
MGRLLRAHLGTAASAKGEVRAERAAPPSARSRDVEQPASELGSAGDHRYRRGGIEVEYDGVTRTVLERLRASVRPGVSMGEGAILGPDSFGTREAPPLPDGVPFIDTDDLQTT